MVAFKKIFIFVFWVVLLNVHCLHGHGFAECTMVRRAHFSWCIKQILRNPYKELLSVLSYDLTKNSFSMQPIKVTGSGTSNCYCKIYLSTRTLSYIEAIECTPSQEFFLSRSEKWVPAYQLQEGDALFSANQEEVWIIALTGLKAGDSCFVE